VDYYTGRGILGIQDLLLRMLAMLVMKRSQTVLLNLLLNQMLQSKGGEE